MVNYNGKKCPDCGKNLSQDVELVYCNSCQFQMKDDYKLVEYIKELMRVKYKSNMKQENE